MRSAVGVVAGGDGPPAEPGWFPRSFPNPSTGSAPSYAPAPSPRLRRRLSPWPPDQRHHPAQEFPSRPRQRGYAMQPDPHPPGWSRWFPIEGRSVTGSYPYASPSRLPSPHHLAVLIRLVVVEDCSTHHAHANAADRPPALTRLLRQARSGVLPPPQGPGTVSYTHLTRGSQTRCQCA